MSLGKREKRKRETCKKEKMYRRKIDPWRDVCDCVCERERERRKKYAWAKRERRNEKKKERRGEIVDAVQERIKDKAEK